MNRIPPQPKAKVEFNEKTNEYFVEVPGYWSIDLEGTKEAVEAYCNLWNIVFKSSQYNSQKMDGEIAININGILEYGKPKQKN